MGRKKPPNNHSYNYEGVKLAPPPENLENLTDKIQSLEHKLNNLLELHNSSHRSYSSRSSCSPHSDKTIIHSPPESKPPPVVIANNKPLKLPLKVSLSLFGDKPPIVHKPKPDPSDDTSTTGSSDVQFKKKEYHIKDPHTGKIHRRIRITVHRKETNVKIDL